MLELAIPLILVLGHQSCGAVTAAVQADETGEQLPAHIQYLGDRIRPATDRTQHGQARVDSTVNRNVGLVRTLLAAEPDLAGKVESGTSPSSGPATSSTRNAFTPFADPRPVAAPGNRS